MGTLPSWVVSNVESVRREVAPYVDMTPEERGRLVRLACEDAARILRYRQSIGEPIDWQDPLPASSVAALARLREEYRRKKTRDRQ